MARTLTLKRLENARLLKEYASWVYCTGCEKTVAYLCYTTYDLLDFRFTCACGSTGSVQIAFGDMSEPSPSETPLVTAKNRACCPEDGSALLTFVAKNLQAYDCRIACLQCGKTYTQHLGKMSCNHV